MKSITSVIIFVSFVAYSFARNETLLGANRVFFQVMNADGDLYVGDNPGEEGPEVKPGGTYLSQYGYDEENKIVYIFSGYAPQSVNLFWAYNETSSNFRYISGDGSFFAPIYRGIFGVYNVTYFPGSRVEGVGFFSSKLQLFHMGFGYVGSDSLPYSDLWAYNVSSSLWAWVSGPSSPLVIATFNTFNVSSIDAHPGFRYNPAYTWDEETQKFYLLSGFAFDKVRNKYVFYNDIWSYDAISTNWTWIGGNSSVRTYYSPLFGQHSVFGSSLMPSIQFPSCVLDKVRKVIYVFGGYQLASNLHFYLTNDVWGFNIASGTFATFYSSDSVYFGYDYYEIEGVPSLANSPMPRLFTSAFYHQTENAIYFYGGFFPLNNTYTPILGDLWKFEPNFLPDIGCWTFVAGTVDFDSLGSFNSSNPISQANIPEAFTMAVNWYNTETNKFFFGCGATSIGFDCNIWSTTEKWLYFDNINTYWYMANADSSNSTINSTSPSPQGAIYPISGYDETNKVVYSYGGEIANGIVDILWSYNESSKQYSMITGFNLTNAPLVVGINGLYLKSNYPGGRAFGGAFFSSKMNIFFICFGITETVTRNSYGDLWAYNVSSSMWAYLNGIAASQVNGNYSSSKVPAVSYPGARSNFGSAWSESTQSYYIIGGIGYGSSSYGYLNDVWYYNATANVWNFIYGSDMVNRTALYGKHAIYGNSSIGGYAYMTSAFDRNSRIYLYGGSSSDGHFVNDIWGFDTVTNSFAYYRHISSRNYSDYPSYGNLNVPSLTNNPPIRRFAAAYYRNDDGLLYVYGGSSKFGNVYGDVWSFDFGIKASMGTWTWVSGQQCSGIISYGVAGLSTYSNSDYPGSKYAMLSWYNAMDDRFWVGYGAGNSLSTNNAYLSDTWFAFKGWFAQSAVAPSSTSGTCYFPVEDFVDLADATTSTTTSTTSTSLTSTTTSSTSNVKSLVQITILSTASAYDETATTSETMILRYSTKSSGGSTEIQASKSNSQTLGTPAIAGIAVGGALVVVSLSIALVKIFSQRAISTAIGSTTTGVTTSRV